MTTRRGSVLSLWLFRVVVSGHTLVLIAQPFLAGRFLAGDFNMLSAHERVGNLLMPVGMTMVVAALLLWRPGRGPAWPIPVATAVTMASGIQLGAGYDRNLGLHVPLGVGLVVTGVYLTAWAWTDRPRHPAPNPDGHIAPRQVSPSLSSGSRQ